MQKSLGCAAVAAGILLAQTPAKASDYEWIKVLQAPVDESYFGPNDPRNLYDPLSTEHPLPGSKPRRNGGYAWGVTVHGDEIWYGAFMNGWCLWLQPAGLPVADEATAALYNYQSSKNACDLREKTRPPVVQIFDTKSGELEVFQSEDPSFAEAMDNLVAIRAAGTMGDVVFITGLIGADVASASGDFESDESYFFQGVRILAINAANRRFLGSVTLSDLNEARKMSVIKHPDGSEGLYLGASSRSGRSYLLRWTGTAARPFPMAEPGAYPGFEKVIDNSGRGMIGELVSYTDAEGNERLVASTWSSWPTVNKAGGLYISDPLPEHGFDRERPGKLNPLLVLDEFDPDPILGPTWGGGMLSVFDGQIYWGTMTIGSAFAGAYSAVNPELGSTSRSRDNIARALFSRAAHVFRVDASVPDNPDVELLFGNEFYPVINAEDGSLDYKMNRLGLNPTLGDAGFGFGTVNYSWESIVHDGKLFVGTMDYSGGLEDYLGNKLLDDQYQIQANYRVAKEQGFIPGGDLFVFEEDRAHPKVITRSGLGNLDNNGFRNFLNVNGDLYVGTSSEANIGPHAGYSFYRLSK